MKEIILLFLIFFWFFHIQQRIFYSLYFWQIKEYRLDRFLEEVKRKKSFIFPKVAFLALFLFLFLFFLDSDFPKLYFIASFYFILGIRSLYFLIARKWRLPKFTKKMLLLYALCSLLLFFFVLYFIEFEFISFLLIFEVLFPVFIFACVEFLQVPVFLIKKQISRKAREKRKQFKDLIVIGITGSYGKTSTKEFLNVILSQKYKVLKTEGNNNTEIGVAQTVLRKLKKEHQIFICEMAAYRIGEIKTICEIVKPKIGILTGINEQHMALFGSQENIVKAKFELIESLPADGIAFFNGNNKFCQELYQIAPHRTCLPRMKLAFVRGSGAGQAKIKKFLYGQGADSADSENIAGAIGVAKELGMREEEIAVGKEKIKPWLQVKKGINGLNIIDATYSANPTGVISHLNELKKWQGKKIIVMPCLIELGKASREVHQRIGKKIAEVCDLAIITSKECFEDIKSGEDGSRTVLSETRPLETFLFIDDPEKIFEKIKKFNQPEDIILLESRVPKQLIELLNI